MDTRTGFIKPLEELQKDGVPQRYVMEIDEAKLNELQRETLKLRGRLKIGRNQICVCGSGLKFKNCCLNKTNRKIG